MNPEIRENLRLALLQILEANPSQFGLTNRVIGFQLPRYGISNSVAQALDVELRYLQGKGLVAVVGKQISPENTAWIITSEGRDFIAQQSPQQ